MKKLKLLLAAFMAVCGLSMNAQSWTAPTMQGEDPVDGVTYKIYNVSEKKFLTEGQSWFDWSTTAILANSGSDFTYAGSGASFTLTTHRSGNAKFFTSGNGISGDAMHVDGGSPTNYGWTKLSSGYFHIHDAGGNESSLCWGYGTPEGKEVAGVVAHADATNAAWKCDWIFVGKSANALYEARLNLYNLLNQAKSEGVNTNAASTVYENASATANELNEAYSALNISRMEKYLEGKTASAENPIEITEYVLVNPDFEIPTPNGSLPPGWTITITGQNLGQQNRYDPNPLDNSKYIENFIEAWHPNALGPGVIAQTVSSLPEGTYILECDASVCHDDPNWSNEGLGYSSGEDITGAYLFIKSSLKTEQKSLGNRRLDIQHYSVSFSHGGSGEVQFGLMATEGINANWLSADNFKIFYAGGVDLTIYKQALADAVSEFNALESSIDATVYASMQTQVNALNKDYSSSNEYQTAIANVLIINEYATAYAAATAALNNATYNNVTGIERTTLSNAISDAPTYADYNTYADKTLALTEATNVFKAANANYSAYVNYKAETIALFGTDFDIAAPTSAAEAAVAVQNLNIAQYNKVDTEYKFSCSGLIGDFGSWDGTATVGDDMAEPNYLDYEHWSGKIHAYYEQASWGYSNSSGWTIQYQKTCTLPAGDYVIKVAARSSAGTTSSISCSATDVIIPLPNAGGYPSRGINTSGVASWSDDDVFAVGDNNTTTPVVGGGGCGWQWRFLPFTLTEEKEVTMTFYAKATTQYQWMSIADGELLSKTKLAEDVTYNEKDNNTIEDKLIADVTINRTIKADFNTVVLPFDATANQVAAAYGTGTEVYRYYEDSENASAATVYFIKGDGSITANRPVLVKATKASSSQTFKGVKIVATEEPTAFGRNFDFIGTYSPISEITAGDYFIGNGALYKSEGETSIDAFRAYIHAHSTSTEARIISFAIEDQETTAIKGIEVVGSNKGKIYNLKGQEVKNPQKGVYIQNGKIIIIK